MPTWSCPSAACKARATGYFGIHTPIFPTFSDETTLSRFRRLDALGKNGPCKRDLNHEVDHVAWLLGVNFTIQLVPAAGDRILHVLAGESKAVYRRGQQLYDDAWSWAVARRASLVVAAIEGGVQQTWENFGRALEASEALVEDGGAIAVCCDLAGRPGPGMRRSGGGPLESVGLAAYSQGPARRRHSCRATGPSPGSRQRFIFSAGSIPRWSRNWT